MNSSTSKITLPGIALAALLLFPMAQAFAQEADDDDTDEVQAQTSQEQGQTSLSESFEPSRAERIREQRRKAFEDTTYDVHLRSFYFDRNKFDDSESEAWAGGGWAGLKTGWFRDRIAFGVTGYGSFPISADDDKDGTLLLQPGQEGYGVIGELYAEVRITDAIKANIGRRAYDTPYINRNDNRMTPNTFEAYTVTGLYGNAAEGSGEWRFGGGYFDEIKERNADEFVSMSRDAGASVDRGVYALGANWKRGPWSVGAIDYYSDDIINIWYTEAKYAASLSDEWKLTMSAQYTDQQATGDRLLNGTSFDTNQWGVKGDLGWGPALFTIAYTQTSNDFNMQAPWSGYPGYTSVQVEDFNRAGENAVMYRVGYTPTGAPGLSFYALYVDGNEPSSAGQFQKSEWDFNAQYAFPEGSLKGLSFRLRYASVQQEDAADSDLDDVRFIVYYDPPGL
jgi:hypothetical protein